MLGSAPPEARTLTLPRAVSRDRDPLAKTSRAPRGNPPPRPEAREERWATRAFLALAPRLAAKEPSSPPDSLRPFEELSISRSHHPGSLAATWYRGPGPSRGTVVLLHPWTYVGRAYFHRHGRIEALRAAGYDALTFDLPGFGQSGPTAGLLDRDIEPVLRFASREIRNRPLHLWGVSAGGYWAHPVLSRFSGVAGAFFEDVSPHLLEWSWRQAPWGRPAFWLFRRLLPNAYRFLDLRQHAPALLPRAITYVSGERDTGVRPADTELLARLAGARSHIVPGAVHLGAVKTAPDVLTRQALATFAAAEAG